MKTACLLLIGNELLSGRTQDKNMAYLGKSLSEMGIHLRECRVIPDVEAVIIDTLNACRARFDYVFTTGGIGPTHDDITAACVAKAFGQRLMRHPEALKRLEAYYEPGMLNEARLKMAETPEGARLIGNPISAAPGFIMENVYVMAGVPSIMQAMFEGIRGELKGGAPVRSRSLTTAAAEGDIAAGLAAIQANYPQVEIGSYPQIRPGALPGLSIVLRGVEDETLAQAADQVRALLSAHSRDGVVVES